MGLDIGWPLDLYLKILKGGLPGGAAQLLASQANWLSLQCYSFVFVRLSSAFDRLPDRQSGVAIDKSQSQISNIGISAALQAQYWTQADPRHRWKCIGELTSGPPSVDVRHRAAGLAHEDVATNTQANANR